MNIRESAKRARVSTTTMSLTIKRHPSVQPRLVKRVWRIAEEPAAPQELFVIGFDNIHLSQYILAPLSTIEMSQTELGRLAFQALLQDARCEINPKGTEYVLKTSFILRDSTA
jgi:DNA-binding LacI/PurR family transcriptional regulator